MIDSEFSCEVVRVTQVDKHPNADRLEVAHFAFVDGTVPNYQCVVGKGDYVAGDAAIYISDDSIVPLVPGPFEFLKTRIDCKPGATSYRIRAAKLRGEISTGMLIPNTEGAPLGTEMSLSLNVSKYESPAERKEREHALYSGPKPGRFQRLMAWLVSKIYTPVKVPDYSVVSLRKAPNYFSDGEEVVYTEKIHGSNIRFGKIRSRVFIGSHHCEKTDSRTGLLRWLFPRGDKNHWHREDVWTEWFNRVFSTPARLSELPNNVIFYGELFGPGIQPNFDYGHSQTTVKVFNAWDVKGKKWFSRGDMEMLLPGVCDYVFPISKSPALFDKNLLSSMTEMNSEVGAPGRSNVVREGVVVHSLDGMKAGKLVSDRYLTAKR